MRAVLFCCFLMSFSLAVATAKKTKSPRMFTSKKEMEKMVETEKKLYQILTNYTTHLEARAQKLKQFHDEFRAAFEDATQNGIEGYLDNPVSAFLFTRRLYVTWNEVESIMKGDVGKEWTRDLKIKKFLNDVALPSRTDLIFAAAQVKKLQNQYQLNATEMANGGHYGVPLNSGDCFELGKDAYEEEDLERASDWLQEALRRLDDGRSQKEDIMEYLAATAYLQGRIRKALELTEELLVTYPHHEKALNNVKYYRNVIAEIEKRREGSIEKDVVLDVFNWLREDIDNFTRDICNDDVTVSVHVQKKLRCRLVDNGVPFLTLAKLKEEIVYNEPRITLYHDILSESEISALLNSAENRMTPYGKDSDEIINAKSAVLAEASAVTLAATRRAGQMTRLNTKYADLLQVISYDTNGTLSPHIDRQQASSLEVRQSGNQLATVQYFLNDSEGGATVFPALKLAVPAQKGSALVWTNLKRNGLGNDLTMHGTCPVNAGQHWQAVKWLRTFGNEFSRPCARSHEA